MKRKTYKHGGKKEQRMTYGKGGYASIKDMEKHCTDKAGYNESLKSKNES
jgi:hypothetical protein